MTVVVPAGLPILDAAHWVGGSCWLELAAHEALTRLLREGDVDDATRVALWTVRAHRAELAEAWHRRLPELRELPRERFVEAPAGGTAGAVDGPEAAVDLLALLERRYTAHLPVAVGPADGPVAATLRRALELLAADREALPGWLPPAP